MNIAACKGNNISLATGNPHGRLEANEVKPLSASAKSRKPHLAPPRQPGLTSIAVIVNSRCGLDADHRNLAALARLEDKVLAATGTPPIHQDRDPTWHRVHGVPPDDCVWKEHHELVWVCLHPRDSGPVPSL